MVVPFDTSPRLRHPDKSPPRLIFRERARRESTETRERETARARAARRRGVRGGPGHTTRVGVALRRDINATCQRAPYGVAYNPPPGRVSYSRLLRAAPHTAHAHHASGSRCSASTRAATAATGRRPPARARHLVLYRLHHGVRARLAARLCLGPSWPPSRRLGPPWPRPVRWPRAPPPRRLRSCRPACARRPQPHRPACARAAALTAFGGQPPTSTTFFPCSPIGFASSRSRPHRPRRLCAASADASLPRAAASAWPARLPGAPPRLPGALRVPELNPHDGTRDLARQADQRAGPRGRAAGSRARSDSTPRRRPSRARASA